MLARRSVRGRDQNIPIPAEVHSDCPRTTQSGDLPVRGDVPQPDYSEVGGRDRDELAIGAEPDPQRKIAANEQAALEAGDVEEFNPFGMSTCQELTVRAEARGCQQREVGRYPSFELARLDIPDQDAAFPILPPITSHQQLAVRAQRQPT